MFTALHLDLFFVKLIISLYEYKGYSNLKSIIMTNGVLLLALLTLALSADIQRVAELQTETVFA